MSVDAFNLPAAQHPAPTAAKPLPHRQGHAIRRLDDCHRWRIDFHDVKQWMSQRDSNIKKIDLTDLTTENGDFLSGNQPYCRVSVETMVFIPKYKGFCLLSLQPVIQPERWWFQYGYYVPLMSSLCLVRWNPLVGSLRQFYCRATYLGGKGVKPLCKG